MTSEDWLTVDEAAEALGVRRQRVIQYLKRNRLRGAFKHGPVWVIPRTAVGEFHRLVAGRPKRTPAEV